MVITIKNMIPRKDYIQQLGLFIDKPLVKILTGIRRSGKSSILMLLKEELLHRGIDPEKIIYINFESFSSRELLDSAQLYEYVSKLTVQPKRSYLLLDEIQEVKDWERCINSFMVDMDVDIYITGSNSHLLSSELSTFLAGRYIEIAVHTLSFEEYLEFHSVDRETNKKLIRELFQTYLRYGGFPVINTSDYNEDTVYKIVFDIYSSVILRDTIQRSNIRDVELLERVLYYVFDNIGNTFSGKNIADYFKSQQRKIDINTVYNYLKALEGAFILYRARRYDIKGKEILKTLEKFYLSDVSLLYATMGYKDRLISGILENIVYLELKRRNYNVFVGKTENREIDFVAEKQGKKIYVQVAYIIDSKQTAEREFSELLNIRDQYPKFVVTMDEFWKESIEGVQHFHIADFLLSRVY